MNVIRAVAITGLVQVFGVFLFLSCATPPAPIPVLPDAASDTPSDIFTGATIDCSEEATNPPVDEVRTCGDMTNVDSCLADLVVGTRTADVVGCTVRGMDMAFHAEMTKGTATDATKTEAYAFDRWFRSHNISVRE